MSDNCQNKLSRGWTGLVALIVVVGAGCVQPLPRAPQAKGIIPDMTLEPGEEESLSVASYFIDQDGDVLTYTASSATESAATVSMDGSRLTVTAVAVGESQVTVTAADPIGEGDRQKFKVTVKISG